MIPATNNKLLVAEDWKKIYSSYRNADFKSYDFETIRRTMVQYLQENYPEDFNDFIDSSEYIALIDLIAYLGQNLSFRIDLNARENFLETASRRDSILRLAQLISYAPKRNLPANGFLKITAVSTTDSVLDSSNINLANTTILWNDASNTNWYNQFTTILNSAMPGAYVFGKPYDRAVINGVTTEQYRINSANTDVPVFSFLKNINGTNMNFEIVSSTFSGSSTIYEEPPRPGNSLSVLYKNDNQGSSSVNTGYFVHFRQGTLGLANFTINTPIPNEIIGINTPGINNEDVWLWQLSSNGVFSTLWDKVPSVIGNNVIYNSLYNSQRNIFSVTTRDQDQIDINFADGSFGNLPKGDFKLLYRVSNGISYSIRPEQMSGITIDIPYYNKSNALHTLTVTLNLGYSVNNSSGQETNESIKSKAPQTYYTQNRMITAEDYNIAPLTLGNDILKVKSVNRVTSGISKFFDLSDVSGKYGNTNIFANDGILYKNTHEQSFEFEFSNNNEIFYILKSQLAPIVSGQSMKSFYMDNYERPDLSYLNLKWNQVNSVADTSRGYFSNISSSIPQSVAGFTDNNLTYVSPGALVKFVPPAGYFNERGKIVSGQSSTTKKYLWSKVVQVVGDGSNSGKGALDDGTGPIIFSNTIPTGSIPVEVVPKFTNIFTFVFESEIVSLCLSQRNFGLSFDRLTRQWNIISDTNLDLYNPFSFYYQGDTTNSAIDSSWLIAFTWTGKNYKVRYRITDYIFESNKETGFYLDPNNISYDYATSSVIKDEINVLSINTAVTPTTAVNTSTLGSLGLDYKWQVDSSIIEPDGYIEPSKIKISFYDYNNLGQINDPDAFNNIVEPTTLSTLTGHRDKFVYFYKLGDGLRYQLTTTNILSYPNESAVEITAEFPADGDLFYFYDTDVNVVKSYSTSSYFATNYPWVYEPNYFAFPGRSDLKFQYKHNSGEDRRIDPSKSNFVDVYLLTSQYDSDYRNWLNSGSIGTAPLAPTPQSLEENYGSRLNAIKAIGDEIIFQPARYKVLFGSNAQINLQATFKAVRNPSLPTSDNDLKTRILSAINEFFSLEYWDFGQTFYFTELATYVLNQLTPDITNFVMVPKANNFGSLYEIYSLSNEILISGATVSDIDIIDAVTAVQLGISNKLTNS